MKKNNSSLLYAILGGIVTCFIVIGMVFMFSSNDTKSYKSNSSNLVNQGVSTNDDEEINLGANVVVDVSDGGGGGGSSTTSQSSAAAPTQTANTCSISRCTNYLCRTNDCCRCTNCETGFHVSGGKCAANTPTPNNRPCCNTCAGNTYCLENCQNCSTPSPAPTSTSTSVTWVCCCSPDDTQCSWLKQCTSSQPKSGNASSGKCTNPTPTPTPNCKYSTKTLCQTANSGRECWLSGGCYVVKECSQYPVYNCPTSYCTKTSTACTATPTCGEWEKLENGKCVKDISKVTSTCCETSSSGTKTTINSLSGCQQAFMAGANVVSGECPTSKCLAGTYGPVGVEANQCTKCKAGTWSNAGATNCSKCPEGSTSDEGAKSVKECKSIYVLSGDASPAYVTPGQCRLYTFTVTTSDGTPVTSGVNWTVNNGKVIDGCGSGTKCQINVCGAGCYKTLSASVSASVNAVSVGTKAITINSYKDWAETKWGKEMPTGGYIYNSFDKKNGALANDTCVGYSVPNPRTGISEYRYYRCCGSAPVAHCYKDNDGDYHWTSSPNSSWVIVSNITKEADCKKEETPACYKKPNGDYVWGKYATTSGYTLITSISDKNSCKKPTADEACYKKNDHYIWTSEAPTGYTKVEGVTKPEDCAPEESPACYLHDSDYVWGKYEKITGYIFIENITEESKCKKPVDSACYVDSDGNYVWGQYGDDNTYSIVPSVTNISECTNDVPVPKTAANVSKLVYVFMAILMAFGIGFIYYSTVVKKNQNQ